MECPVPTVVISDNRLTREGLAGILCNTSFEVMGVVGSADEAKLAFFGEKGLIVIAMSDASVVFPTLAAARQRFPARKHAVIVDRADSSELRKLWRAGADGCLLNDIPREALVKSLDLIVLGQRVFPFAEETGLLTSEFNALDHRKVGIEQRNERLTGREATILRRVALGESNKMIARQFAISESTVKVHIKTILRKIRAHNRTQAAIWAVENGMGGESGSEPDPGKARTNMPAPLETGG